MAGSNPSAAYWMRISTIWNFGSLLGLYLTLKLLIYIYLIIGFSLTTFLKVGEISSKFDNINKICILEKVVGMYYYRLYNTSGQSYKHFTLVNYDSRVVIWGIFQSGMTLES